MHTLQTKPGDVVVVHFKELAKGSAVADTVAKLTGCLVVVLEEGDSIHTLNDAQMFAAGWVRKGVAEAQVKELFASMAGAPKPV